MLETLTPVAWLVVNERGFTSLHQERVRAEDYATKHLQHGVVEALVKLSDVRELVEGLFASRKEISP